MKQVFFLPILFLIACSFIQTASIPEPEFSSRPYYLKDGNLVNLERVDAIYDVKVVALGYGGSNGYYSAFGTQSTVQFNKASLPHFYIKLEGKVDVSDNPIQVFVGEVKKDRRRFKVSSQALGGKARDVSSGIVIPSLKKVREGLYEIVFENGLLPGEYAFSPMTSYDLTNISSTSKPKLCCFSVK